MNDTQHNRKLNLMKALKSIRIGDFQSDLAVSAIHGLFLILDEDHLLRQGVDVHGLTANEAHSVSINNIIEAIKAVRDRVNIGIVEAKALCEAHPAYEKSRIIRQLENDGVVF